MIKNIVLCSDGTGNTFSKHVSNVTRLIKSVELDQPDEQIVFYDQGIGTNPKLVNEVEAFQKEPGTDRKGLTILPAPQNKFPEPLTRIRGLLSGYGLRENVKEMYKALAENYNGEKDQIFLFGFSRGAFTVRALAGLINRCGLPTKSVAKNAANFDKCFLKAYELYEPHANDKENKDKIQNFKVDYHVRDCPIRFLGIWDTVKSYGGVLPQSLPHLRHNPIVKTVCHALALEEHRSWFVHTTWGWLDSDKKNLNFIEPDGPDDRYKEQEIKEVWFRGFHSDVGGGDDEKNTAEIPLRWMLREASGLPSASGLRLNQYGQNIVSKENPKKPPPLHESRTLGWKLSEIIPRKELDNEHREPDGGPQKHWNWGSTAKRDLEKFRRDGYLCLHSSVANNYTLEKVHNETATFIPKCGWRPE
jgi:uncharacterized protein (DUF2235 family)